MWALTVDTRVNLEVVGDAGEIIVQVGVASIRHSLQ